MRTMPEPVITISEMKRILSRDGDALEYMVKVASDLPTDQKQDTVRVLCRELSHVP